MMNICTCTKPENCRHDNGWYDTIRFWIFKKEVFFCTDCSRAIPAEQAKQPMYFY